MVFTKEWTVRSEKTLDITEQVEKTVLESGIRNGLVQVETCELASGVLRAGTGIRPCWTPCGKCVS